MMMNPTFAFCAVPPEGAIDIDMLRRSRSSAEYAAKLVVGKSWPQMSGEGWKIQEIEMRVRGAAVAQAAKAAAQPAAGFVHRTERMSADAYRQSLVRMGG